MGLAALNSWLKGPSVQLCTDIAQQVGKQSCVFGDLKGSFSHWSNSLILENGPRSFDMMRHRSDLSTIFVSTPCLFAPVFLEFLAGINFLGWVNDAIARISCISLSSSPTRYFNFPQNDPICCKNAPLSMKITVFSS